MSMVRALRTLTALENGTLTGANLQTQLGTAARLGEWAVLMASPSACARMAASATTMTAVLTSALARAEVLKSQIAMQAIWASDNALTLVAAATGFLADARSSALYSVASATGNSSMAVPLPLPGGKYIVLGTSRASTVTTGAVISTKRTNSAISGSMPTSGTSNTLGKDFDTAVPIQAPFSFVGNSAFATQYFGVLRCDI